MIIARLLGGLGNQLFQYAAARAVALRHGQELRFDISGFASLPGRSYRLDHFRIDGRPIEGKELRALGVEGLHFPWGRLKRKLGLRPAIPVITEPHFHFDPRLEQAPAHCYLSGYWQSPRYFADIEPQIRQEFQVRDPLSENTRALAERIAASESVAIHVRRGDYISNPTAASVHGICGSEYYAAAERLLLESRPGAQAFVFSDEPAWAASNLRLSMPAAFVDHNPPDRDYEDLHLMAQCKHHIIANSTFSWWGAWLATNPHKFVVAPRGWFKGVDHRVDDLIPREWQRA
ncbi:MAG: alpha-1,2-fucosyltransferase [Pseudomonadota bacterium]|jgi:hypothetical protein